jgi:hypothetical protein
MPVFESLVRRAAFDPTNQQQECPQCQREELREIKAPQKFS